MILDGIIAAKREAHARRRPMALEALRAEVALGAGDGSAAAITPSGAISTAAGGRPAA